MELTAIRTLKLEIAATEQKLLALRENAQSITAKLDGLPRSQSLTSKVEKFAAQIVDAENELSRLVIEFAESGEELTTLIKQRVKGNAATVLYRRYILCENFKEIADAMSYSENNIYYLHRQGVRSFSLKNP